jgi:hypothetical protein
LDLQADPYDPCSSECLTRVEGSGRLLAFEIMRYLQAHAEGFERPASAAPPRRQAFVRADA